MAAVYLGLGSNLGNRRSNLRAALRGLWRMGRVEAVSRLYQTDPVGVPSPQPPFLNAACLWQTGLEPRPLLRFLQSLEREIGRRPAASLSPRPIDLDILLYDDRVVSEEGLVVPHPRLAERAFVLVPLADIAPEARHPGDGRTVGEMLAAAGRKGVRRVAGRGWEELEGMAEQTLRL